jgi:DNA-binding NarL/FixJ family response regulator
MPEPDPDVVLVDDHPLLAEGLRIQLDRRGITLEIAPELQNEAILKFVEKRAPSLVVLDYAIPQIGVSTPLIAPIIELGPTVLFLTGTNDPALWGSLIEAGAIGVMSKEEPLSQLLDGIESALTGAPFRPTRTEEYREAWRRDRLARQERLAPFGRLSAREREVTAALVEGHSPAEIATSSFVSVGTVRSQLKSIYSKLGVSSQLELVTMAHKADWTGDADGDGDADSS